MSYRHDLTRWNRSGLTRFRYVDHNAANYIETIRLQLKHNLTELCSSGSGSSAEFNWDRINRTLPANETLEKRIERLEIQYKQPTQDITWEIIRSFSRATHIITEYLNAYANEGYLETATQWDNIRKLVELLDYRPAPPASASTHIGIYAKEGSSGTVNRGLQIKHVPKDGSKPVVFETLKPIDVSSELNELRLDKWNFSVEPSIKSVGDGKYLFVAHEKYELSKDDVCILVNSDSGDSKAIIIIDPSFEHEGNTKIMFKTADSSELNPMLWLSGSTRIWSAPSFIAKPSLNGENIVKFKKQHGLDVGRVIAWHDNGWKSNVIIDKDEFSIRLDSNSLPATGTHIYEAYKVKGRSNGSGVDVPLGHHRRSLFDSDYNYINESDLDDVKDADGVTVINKFMRHASHVFLVNKSNPLIGVITEKESGYRFEGDPGELRTGNYVVANYVHDSKLLSERILSVEKYETYFKLGIDSAETSGLVRLFSGFTKIIKSKNYNYNATPLNSSGLSLGSTGSNILTPLMDKGRQLILSKVDESEIVSAIKSKVIDVVKDASYVTLHVDPLPVEQDGFTIGNTIINMNVIDAGHGETRKEKTLGSGDASKISQEFLLNDTELSFVSDATFPVGVKADIEVFVGNQRWTQVHNLLDSEDSDPHYMTVMTEDNLLRILFGDGKHGRRLVTGINNIKVNYRKGNGVIGNHILNSLTKIVKPHPLIDFVIQPIATSGGGGRENNTSLKGHASSS
ncbi:MAG: hypothetical protein OEY89_17275, partial [Gammaproteobacteria bacterium]|nr:hypothetical protein [Gammaproteobacteria bacterium]